MMKLSWVSQDLVENLDAEQKKSTQTDREINQVVSRMAVWYEKLRNALEYHEEEVILRAAIERILKRKLIFERDHAPLAEELIKELIWAKYFPENVISDEMTDEIRDTINHYLKLEDLVRERHRGNRLKMNEWILQLLSCEIERILRTSDEKELLTKYVFQILSKNIRITDQSEDYRDIIVFIAVHKAFGKEDLPMLRFALFAQMFGNISNRNVEQVAEVFPQACNRIQEYIDSPYKDKVYNYIRKQVAAFYILEDVFSKHRGRAQEIAEDEEEMTRLVQQSCNNKYEQITKKIQTATARSVAFIFLTKAIFGITIETTFERLIYGQIHWLAIGINIMFSPVLMFLSTLFISKPDRANTQKIVDIIKQVLYYGEPELLKPLSINKASLKVPAPLYMVYMILWFIALVLGLLGVNYVLSYLHFNPISKVVFVFFLAVVSFMSYRISQSAKTYTVTRGRDGMRSAFFDFFFVPFIQVGKYLTVGISQINIILFVFDYIIEAPFKQMFTFLEKWLFFLRSQRETLD